MHAGLCMHGISLGMCVGLQDVVRGVGGHEIVAREAGPRVCEGRLLPPRRDLDTNELTGTIPTGLGNLSSLQYL